MAGSVGEARVGKSQVRAATLVIETQGISAREAHADALVDAEGHRAAHAGNYQPVLAGRGESGEIRLIDLLIGRGCVFVAHVRARCERSCEDLGAGDGIDKLKCRIGGNGHFAEAASVVAYHCLFGIVGQVTFLVDVDGWVKPQGIGGGDKLNGRGPEGAARVEDLDGLVVGDRPGQLQIKRVRHAQIIIGHGRVERAALEADCRDGNRLTIGCDGESA
jgi:hypothetical protein